MLHVDDLGTASAFSQLPSTDRLTMSNKTPGAVAALTTIKFVCAFCE